MSDRAENPERYDSASEAKTGALIKVLTPHLHSHPMSILVVGCGEGYEAGILARAFGAETTGIDTCKGFAFDRDASRPAKLCVMDARNLQLPNACFDLVYSFHALEHIPHPEIALREMARVLKPQGTYLIGTPNSRRMIGYVGSTTSLWNKAYWNLVDLSKRLRGRWTNEAGAHAGFSEAQLIVMCEQTFGQPPRCVSNSYYRELYPARAIDAIKDLHISSLLYPCVYVVGHKK